jgi:hypothetical protein
MFPISRQTDAIRHSSHSQVPILSVISIGTIHGLNCTLSMHYNHLFEVVIITSLFLVLLFHLSN